MSPLTDKTTEIGYQPALDGLRGVSILVVMAFNAHLAFARGGFLGVDLFFVLSGFLITSLLLEEHRRTGHISLKNFYFRRALRLLPALFALMCFCAAYALLFQPRAKAVATFEGIAYTLFYVANWAQIGSLTAGIGALSHAWSLSVEEQFYILWPLVLIVLLKIGSRRWIVGILAVLALASLGWSAWLGQQQPNYLRMYFGSDTRAYELLIGCIAAFVVHARSFARVRYLRVISHTLAIISFAAIIYSFYAARVYLGFNYRGGFTLISLATALVIFDIVAFPSVWWRMLEFSPLVWIGKVSYGLYLWHFPIFEGLRQLLAEKIDPVFYYLISFSVVFLVATASYYVLERPFLKLRRNYRSSTRAPSAVAYGAAPRVSPAYQA